MDAVKFMKEKDRMCKVYGQCDDCPIKQEIACCCDYAKDYEFERVVEIVEIWSKRNPEEVGKKYIIEVDLFDDTNGTPLQYHIKGTVTGWVSKKELESFEEYKEGEE